MASIAQTRLLGYLQQTETQPGGEAGFKRTLREFVLEYGWWYEPGEVTGRIARGTPQECYKNATLLAAEDDSLIYCEGFALFKSGGVPRLHAWVTDGDGRAIDNTWPQAGVCYAGVPFQSLFVTMTALKNHAAISLLDDRRNRYPLLGGLGGRPGEWLEPLGRGIRRLRERLE
jgi:hypothetical protein